MFCVTCFRFIFRLSTNLTEALENIKQLYLFNTRLKLNVFTLLSASLLACCSNSYSTLSYFEPIKTSKKTKQNNKAAAGQLIET